VQVITAKAQETHLELNALQETIVLEQMRFLKQAATLANTAVQLDYQL
jgi:hypothetical protein